MKTLFAVLFASFALIQSGHAGIGFGAIPGALTFDSLVSVKKHPATLASQPATSRKRGLTQKRAPRPRKMLRLTSL
jgi:hypothetical protein